MSNRLDVLLTRMPSHFAKNEDSNNYKLLSLIAEGSEETRAVYETMLKFWDVDQSEGVGLDRLGKDEGISRGGWDDEEYRKMIKIQCILNMSNGDIPTMTTIFDVYFGDNFVSVEDAWSSDFKREAAIVITMRNNLAAYNADLVRRVKSAGVAVILNAFAFESAIFLIDTTYHYPIYFKVTGEMVFEILETHQSNAQIDLQDATYSYNIDFDVYEVETTNVQGTLPVQDATYGYQIELQRTGEMEPVSAETTVSAAHGEVQKESYGYQVIYPVTGEAVTGEGWFDE